MRAFDWSRTPLGPVGTWPPALRTLTGILLAHRFPLLLWWGPEYIQLYNDAFLPILGGKHPEALGQPARLCWPEIWSEIGPRIDAPFRGGPAVWEDDLRLEINRHGGIEAVHLTIAFSPVPDDTAPGGIGGVLATVHDITARVVGERRRAEALADLDRAKTAFFSNVSHEFRTPLSLILGPLEDLLAQPGEPWPPEARELLDMAHRNGQRLLKLVNTLLDFSRIEAGHVRALYEPVDLAAYTAELAGAFRGAVEKAGLRFHIDCPPLPEPAYVDRDMWEKIVLNLVSNAFKYTLEGDIRVSLRSRDGRAVLEVRDTGSGIPAGELPKLFNRFYRVEGTRGRTQDGTGIGLALVQELARLHQGQVGVSSRPGEGSAFTVSIPLGRGHLPADRLGESRGLRSRPRAAAPFVEEALRWLPGGGARAAALLPGPVEPSRAALRPAVFDEPRAMVVVADDNADMRDSLQRLLQAGYDVIPVADGQEALQVAMDLEPDLVLAEAAMPNLNGAALLKALRADPHTAAIPVILLSARSGEEARPEVLRSGADDYLVKPFGARELFARVGGVLALSRVRKEARRRERELRAETLTVLENMSEGFFSLDAECRFAYVNAAAERIHGLARERMLGRSHWAVFPRTSGTALEAAYRRALAERATVELEYCFEPGPGRLGVKVCPAQDGHVAVYFREIAAAD